jgi:ABC-type phosphate transport system substrate-binding protein
MRTRHPWMTMMIVFVLTAAGSAAGAEGFQIVVHRSVEGSKISRSVLAEIYQKDVVRWGNDLRICPVDQSSQAPVRRAFTQEILGRSLGEVQKYWTRRLAVDREMPPPTKASDEAVLAFVADKKGAIGYVSGGVDLPPDVKILDIVD